MNRHTLGDLRYLQSLPLDMKVKLTKQRLREWVGYHGEEGVYVSFSGGKDSTVLLDIARSMYPDLKAMFMDVPTQYPELREFAKSFPNVDIVSPKTSFMKVCEKYGFPLFNKEVCENVNGAKKYWNKLKADGIDVYDRSALAELMNERMKKRSGGSNLRLALLLGMLTKDKSEPIAAYPVEKSKFSLVGYQFLLDAPFDISNRCCSIMKKEPAARYAKDTGRLPITAQMAEESRLRMNTWMKHSCNAFDSKHPISNPMSFWTEADVLQYVKEHGLRLCSVYGSVVADSDQNLKCTGCSRTGCMLCGFGAHMAGNDRFLSLKETHEGMYKLLDVVKNNGVTMRQAIEWINEHSDKKILL